LQILELAFSPFCWQRIIVELKPKKWIVDILIAAHSLLFVSVGGVLGMLYVYRNALILRKNKYIVCLEAHMLLKPLLAGFKLGIFNSRGRRNDL
jgi:hypothetical protein